MEQIIALATSIVTLAGMWLAGNNDWRGWALGGFNQILWFIFILVFGAWGLLPLNITLAFVYARNVVKWREESTQAISEPAPTDETAISDFSAERNKAAFWGTEES